MQLFFQNTHGLLIRYQINRMNIINIGRQKPRMHFTDCRNMYRCFIGALIHSGLQRHSFFRILQQPVIGKGILFFAGQFIQ